MYKSTLTNVEEISYKLRRSDLITQTEREILFFTFHALFLPKGVISQTGCTQRINLFQAYNFGPSFLFKFSNRPYYLTFGTYCVCILLS